MKTPTTFPAFRRWLNHQFDAVKTLAELGEPDFYNQLDLLGTVEQANRLACRFGAGDLVGTEQPTITPRDALTAIGRLLAWAERPEPAELLSVSEVSILLGTSVRSVWRMASADEIAPPIRLGGLTKWKRADIQAMIDLAPASKR